MRLVHNFNWILTIPTEPGGFHLAVVSKQPNYTSNYRRERERSDSSLAMLREQRRLARHSRSRGSDSNESVIRRLRRYARNERYIASYEFSDSETHARGRARSSSLATSGPRSAAGQARMVSRFNTFSSAIYDLSRRS